MITLITGTPGSGKTLYTVATILPSYAGRPLYIDGIPDLLVDHQPAEKTDTWHEWLPENAVLVVDECQRIWRPRAASAAVPPAVAAMETHRHRGADIVLITQHPNLLDGNIRRLVGRHLHVRRVWGLNRALVYEWDQATDPARVSTATKSMWPYPKKAFGLYKSASVHTARGQKPPFLLWLAIAMIIALPIGGYYGYNRIQAKINPMASIDDHPNNPINRQPDHSESIEPVHPLIAFTPRFPDDPASAPAYDGMRQVVTAPRIEHCIASRERCICYTQQTTRVQVTDEKCRRIASGNEFNPYQQDQRPASIQTQQRQPESTMPEEQPAETPPINYQGVINLS